MCAAASKTKTTTALHAARETHNRGTRMTPCGAAPAGVRASSGSRKPTQNTEQAGKGKTRQSRNCQPRAQPPRSASIIPSRVAYRRAQHRSNQRRGHTHARRTHKSCCPCSSRDSGARSANRVHRFPKSKVDLLPPASQSLGCSRPNRWLTAGTAASPRSHHWPPAKGRRNRQGPEARSTPEIQ